jgi:hypothetical protein
VLGEHSREVAVSSGGQACAQVEDMRDATVVLCMTIKSAIFLHRLHSGARYVLYLFPIMFPILMEVEQQRPHNLRTVAIWDVKMGPAIEKDGHRHRDSE